MGFFDRLTRVIRANLNSLVGQAEDPEKILEQAVADMEDDLIKMRQSVAQAIATQKRTERQCSQAQSTSEEWFRRAQLALQKGDDPLAREALTRRQSYQETATALQGQIDQHRQIVVRLKQNMVTLENKLSEAKTKKDMYIARARSAKASQQLNGLINGLNSDSSMAAFERMEEKVLELEAQSEAIAELGSSDLENQFKALEGGSTVDDELAAMKAQLAGADSASLPAGASPTKADEVDAELEQLRSRLDDA